MFIRLRYWIFVLALTTADLQLSAQHGFDINAEWRTRVEGIQNADLNSSRPDGEIFVGSRMRLGLRKQLPGKISGYLQFQDSRLWGEEGSTLSPLRNIDLHQGYLQLDSLAGKVLQIRLGRQELHFGSGRLVGRYDWHEHGRAFDALRLDWAKSQRSLTAWIAQVRERKAPAVARNQEFAGLQFSARPAQNEFDLYGLLLYDGRNFNSLADLSVPIEESETGDNHLAVFTLGSRVKLMLKEKLTIDLEGAVQAGDRGQQDVRAFAMAADAEILLPGADERRMQAGFSYGSGDDSPGNDERTTFMALFPDVHAHWGEMDILSWSNSLSGYIGFAFRPTAEVGVMLRAHSHHLATDRDHWYRARGYNIGSPDEVYRRAIPGSGTQIGNELNASFDWRIREVVSLRGGLSMLRVGDFIKTTGGSRADDMYFGYVSLEAKF